MAKPDLNKLKTEIDNRKKERNTMSSPMGGTVSAGVGGVAPRDAFLYGLLESLNTGKETISSSLLKTVDNKVAIKNKETARLPISEISTAPTQQQHIPMPNQRLNEVNMSPERDEQLWAEVERKRKLTLAEQISEYSKIPPVGTPMHQQTGLQQPMNEQYLVENVKKVVDGYLTENLVPVFEEAIKSTIIEMYAVERIKEVLNENKEMIKAVVIETIKEIQARNKAKAQ